MTVVRFNTKRDRQHARRGLDASQIRKAKRAQVIKRVRRLCDRLGRSPTQFECRVAGIHFGTHNLFQSLNDLLEAAGESVRRIGSGHDFRERTERERLRLKVRRCEVCDQISEWVEASIECPHCDAPWIRIRRSA